MLYRPFGNTGVEVSILGFGAMRLKEVERNGQWEVDEDLAIAIIHRAFELGVNYIDTAYGYCHGNSERVVGRALKGWRDRVYVATKVPTYLIESRGDYRRFLEEQLQRLDVDCIDFYHFHALNQERFENVVLKYDLLEEARKARDEGLVRYICFSFHDRPEVMMRLIDIGIFDAVLCQYNLLDRSNEEAMAYAHSRGVGVAVMGPVGGGRLAGPYRLLQQLGGEKYASGPELALRFVFSNPHVSVALSGMNTMEMVEENARIASRHEPLNDEEMARIRTMMREYQKLADLYCTECAYCMPCPNGVDIPTNFRLMNYYRVYGLEDWAREEYRKMPEEKRASACLGCGECEPKCPQKISVRQRLEEVARTLEE